MKCVATTVRGEKCLRWAADGSDRCTVHQRERGVRAKLTPELVDRLVALLSAANNVKVACQSVGIGVTTFNVWIDRGRSPRKQDAIYRNLRERVEVARAQSEARAVAQVAQAGRDDWRAAAWLLERSAPERWGDRKPSEADAERAKVYQPAAAKARAEALATLEAIGEPSDLSDGAIDRYADACGVWRVLEAEWRALGQPIPHPIVQELVVARREASLLGATLGLDPQSRRRLSMRVAGGRPQGAASAPDRAAPPTRRTLRSVS